MFLQSYEALVVEFAGGRQVHTLLSGRHDARAAGALDGVGGVIVISGRKLPELRPEFGGQIPLVERQPTVGYRRFKGFDSIFFILVLLVIR